MYVQDLFPDTLRLLLAHLYGCLEAVAVDDAPVLFSAATRCVIKADGAMQVCIQAVH